MSEQDEQETDEQETAPEAESSGESEDWRDNFDADKASERIRKLQSEAKNLRERAKTAEQKAAGLDERDQRISSLEGQLTRERVGRRLGLPDELIDRLRGDGEDEILADAEKLVTIVSRGKPGTSRPTEELRGGGEPEADPAPDLRKIAGEITRR